MIAQLCARTLLFLACATSCAHASAQSDAVESSIRGVKKAGHIFHFRFNNIFFSSQEVASATALYRCATLAKEQGKPFFLVYGTLTAVANNRPEMEADIGPLRLWHVPMYVRLLDAPSKGAYRTDDVLTDLKTVVDDGYFPAPAPSPTL